MLRRAYELWRDGVVVSRVARFALAKEFNISYAIQNEAHTVVRFYCGGRGWALERLLSDAWDIDSLYSFAGEGESLVQEMTGPADWSRSQGDATLVQAIIGAKGKRGIPRDLYLKSIGIMPRRKGPPLKDFTISLDAQEERWVYEILLPRFVPAVILPRGKVSMARRYGREIIELLELKYGKMPEINLEELFFPIARPQSARRNASNVAAKRAKASASKA